MIDLIISIFLIVLCEDLVLSPGFHILAWTAAISSTIKILITIVDIMKADESLSI